MATSPAIKMIPPTTTKTTINPKKIACMARVYACDAQRDARKRRTASAVVA